MASAAQNATSKSFQGRLDGVEHFITLSDVPSELGFLQQIGYLEDCYAATQRQLGLTPETAVFRRIHVSDVLNQKPAVAASRLGDCEPDDPVAVSIVQQPPLSGAKLSLHAYHIQGDAPLRKRRVSPHDLLVERSGRRHLWTTGLCAGAEAAPASAAGQTHVIFDALTEAIAGQGGTLAGHCVRTWLYLKDVDVFYGDMVTSRRALFREQGLTEETHFIASTGIEGACGHQFDLVAMDAYSALDLQPGQVSYLNAPDHLCATKDYGVTFERGTRIGYADRAHHFISGTASIDRQGMILHSGDVLRQLDRALENVDALLESGSASLADMMGLTVYLRDPTDYPKVDVHLRRCLPDMPFAIVQGAVCRPGWLIEVEGIAIAAREAPCLPSF